MGGQGPRPHQACAPDRGGAVEPAVGRLQSDGDFTGVLTINGPGTGNKAIALAHCKRVRLDGFTIFKGGHFAVLASEIDGLDITNLAIDTNRDGLDLDCVRRARIERCRVNTPNDDAIVLKTSLGLGRRASCEDIEIRDCEVSGFDLGTMLDGTRKRTQELSPDRDRVTGRIKLGTESNGDFRRIRIANCRFERSRGLALETVDGGAIEDVLAENIVMADVTTAPLFLRLGARLRERVRVHVSGP